MLKVLCRHENMTNKVLYRLLTFFNPLILKPLIVL